MLLYIATAARSWTAYRVTRQWLALYAASTSRCLAANYLHMSAVACQFSLILKWDQRSHRNIKQIARMRSAVLATMHTHGVLTRYCKLRTNSCNCWQDTFGICTSADKIDVLSPLKNAISKQSYNNNNDRFTALCPGLPGWAGTRINTHPPTILIIIQSLSASSIYHDP